ncbi:hypothetical protein [Chryseolinea sp. H1M3-3]|uniref:hypothetical protein n=1 Tax=Chryseolinea sp. H1M3-3 TaxID=3034144 RepID=UPI0023EDAC53|nr:hypothetical protein [Chryseolinea sp. H1M3-3]
MYDRIDQLVEINLKRLFEDMNQELFMTDFIDEKGNRLRYINNTGEAKRLADYMQSKGLINITGQRCDLTEFGHNVYEHGGWLEYSEDKKAKVAEETQKRKKRDEVELLKLKRENKLAKWQVIVFWPVLILGSFGGIYGAYDIIKKSMAPKEVSVITKAQLDSAINSAKISILDSLKKEKAKIVIDSSQTIVGD